MHTYRRFHDKQWGVGSWQMTPVHYGNETKHINEWHALRNFKTERQAASYVNYLNGGASAYLEYSATTAWSRADGFAD
jgi:hypothetical protein